MSFEVTTLTESGKISFDFEAGKKYLEEQLEVYKGMLFTEETKKQAKDTVAELRKQKKAFAERIKEVKAEYMKPYEDFLTKANTLLGLYEEPINFINQQIEDFEAKRIAEKKEAISRIFGEIISEMSDVLPLNKIYNSKWENATFTEKQIKDEMMTLKDKVKAGYATIETLDADFIEEGKQIFLNNGYDIAQTIISINARIKQRDEFRQKEAERIRQMEEERIRREERMKIEAEQAIQKAKEESQQEAERARAEAVESLIPDVGGPVDEYVYRIKLNASEKEKLDMYMNSVGIEFDFEIVF